MGIPTQSKLTPSHNWNIVESGVKHHNPNPITGKINENGDHAFFIEKAKDVFIHSYGNFFYRAIVESGVKHHNPNPIYLYAR
jgi:hypothetical protein